MVVAAVPWARHDAGHTTSFDEQVAWLATQTCKSALSQLMRIAWRTVGAVVARVWADVEAVTDRFEGLSRIGIDEIAYKRGHLYLLVVVEHDTGRLVWAAPGRDSATLQQFFDALGPARCAKITHVTADSANFIATTVAGELPERGAMRRPVPRREVGRRRAGSGPPSILERGPGTGGPQGRPVRAVEEPRGSHRETSRPSSLGSPPPTPRCTGLICSRKACD